MYRIRFHGRGGQGMKIPTEQEHKYIGAACAGAAARLLGVIDAGTLVAAVTKELSPLGKETVVVNLTVARRAYAATADQAGKVQKFRMQEMAKGL